MSTVYIQELFINLNGYIIQNEIVSSYQAMSTLIRTFYKPEWKCDSK